MDAAIPADAQNAPTGIWKSRTEREIPTAPTPIIVVVNERKNNGDSNSVAKPSTESDQAQEMVEEPQGQGGLDGEIRVPPLPTTPAAPTGRPGGDRLRGQPHRHIAASNEGLVIGRPVRNAVLRLIRGMNLRLHPRSVAPAETRRAGQTAPPADLHATTPRVAAGAGHPGAQRLGGGVARRGPAVALT